MSARETQASAAKRREWLLWFALLILVTILLVLRRDRLGQVYVALAYLLVVQGGSARGGRPLGLALAGAAFLAFDLFFLPPFGRLAVADPLNWLVLVSFLISSIVSAQLLYRAQREAEQARLRTSEVDRLAALGAETLNAGHAADALCRVAAMIRTTLAVDDCAIFAVAPDTGERTLACRASIDGFDVNASVAALDRPLVVRGRTVGVLRIASARGLSLGASELRVLDALAYYAALGVERVRLVAEGERAAMLQEAHRAKDAVLASVSHDLRTPLTTIKGLAHEIAEQGDERAMVIEEEADRLSAFVAKLLDLSRVTSGAAADDVQPNEAEDLLGAAAQRSSGSLAGRELRIELDPNEPLLFGRFDFAQTLRALVNLIENAAKYSPPAAPIVVRARRDGAMLRFAVDDEGPGVAASDVARIFEPFQRGPRGTPGSAGAGLGLSIARGIAEAQGGSLTYASRQPHGSCFELSVPAIDVSELARGEVEIEPS